MARYRRRSGTPLRMATARAAQSTFPSVNTFLEAKLVVVPYFLYYVLPCLARISESGGFSWLSLCDDAYAQCRNKEMEANVLFQK